MIVNGSLANIEVSPPLTGWAAPFISMAALALPTVLLLVDHSLRAGACCTTYFPFVLFTVLLSGPFYGSAVAIGSAGLADALFMGPPYQLLESPMDKFGDLASLLSSALIIACVSVFRKMLARNTRQQVAADSPSGVIFSLEKGVASVSWPGSNNSVRLGPEEEVTRMMQDFLAQGELAERLSQARRG